MKHDIFLHMNPAAVGNEMHRRLCHFRGRVQGVGFRYTVQNLAMQYNVAGYIKNLPDGTVELLIEGPDNEMESLLEDVSRKMNPYIRAVDQRVCPATGEFDYFAIRH
jgi:acylphosphatase